MESNSVLGLLIFIVASLMIGAILKFVLNKSRFPYTVGLFLVGLAIGVLDRVGLTNGISLIHNAIDSVGNADPHTLLFLFLPILIFDAAYEMDFHIFKKNLFNAVILAVPGVVIAMGLSACLMMGLRELFPEYSNWTWTIAMMFGALISATDPVAVVSLLKELKTSKRFSTLVDAESLLNDGTGIVLFMMFFSVFSTNEQISTQAALSNFMIVVFGGIILGVVLAAICMWFITKVKGESNLQNSTIILASYLTFMLAESVLHVSGVIALVAFGLIISYYGKLQLDKAVTSFVGEFWELAAYIANTLIFIIVGIVIALRIDITLTNILILFLVYIGIMLIRALTVFLFFPIMKRLGYGLNLREGVILSWGGLRGAVGLTLALMVVANTNIPEDVRGQILFFAAGIVALTLTINATTIGWLLRKLGLAHHTLVEYVVDHSVNGKIRSEMEKYLEELKNNPTLKMADWGTVETFLPEKFDLSQIPDIEDELVQHTLRTKILEQESDLSWKLYNQGVFSRHVLTKISSIVEFQNDNDGSIPLTQQQEILGRFIKKKSFKKYSKIPFLNSLLKKKLEEKIIDQFELCRSFIILQHSALSLLDMINRSSSFPDIEKCNLDVLREELKNNIEVTNELIDKIASAHPEIYSKAVTEKASNMMQTKSKEITRRYRESGFIK